MLEETKKMKCHWCGVEFEYNDNDVGIGERVQCPHCGETNKTTVA